MNRRVAAVVRVTRAGSALAAVLSAHAACNARMLRTPRVSPTVPTDTVSVCIPARDESSQIGRCLAAVLAAVATSGAAVLEVCVLDDASTDGTGEVARSFGEAVDVIDGATLPSGWLGKPHACEQLRVRARGSVLVFVDADVVLAPEAIAASVAELRAGSFAMVCPYPRQIARSPAERLVQPLLQWLWLTFLPLRLAERTKPVSMTAANGQLMVIDAAALADIGGFAAVRDRVLDDVELARALKRSGRRVALVDGTRLAACRMYDDWPSLRDGYAKSLWAATGSPVGAAAISALLALVYVVPPLACAAGTASRQPRLIRAGAVGTVIGIAGRMVSAQRTGGSVRDSIAHPFSISMLIGLIARSWRAHHRGANTWKGRSVDG